MRARDKDVADEIFFLRRHAHTALPAALLSAISRKRHALNIAFVAYGHDHVFALNQVLDIGFKFRRLDLRAARRSELDLNRGQFVRHDLKHAFAIGKDIEIIRDLRNDFFQVVSDLVAFKPRQAMQPKIKDSLGLRFAKLVSRIFGLRVISFVNKRD